MDRSIGFKSLQKESLIQSAENHWNEYDRLWIRLRHALILILNVGIPASVKKLNGVDLNSKGLKELRKNYIVFGGLNWGGGGAASCQDFG